MQVLVTVIDDNGKAHTLQLEWFKETRNFIRYKAGDKDTLIIADAWVHKSLHASGKSISALNR